MTEDEKTGNDTPDEEEETPEESGANSQTLIDKANEAAKRIEDANKKQEELVKRSEAAKVRDRLGGEAEAGIAPVKPVEDTPEEFANKVLEGKINLFEDEQS